MKLKKIFTSAVAALAASAIMCVNAFAAGDTYTDEVKGAKDATNRQQSYSVEFSSFDPTRMTKDSEVIVSYEIVKGQTVSGEDNVELVAQKYPDEQRKDYKGKSAKVDGDDLWKIVKADSDDGKGQATFSYDSIVKAFGYSDFTVLDKLNVEAASEKTTIKCTGFKVTNVKPEKEGTHPKVETGFAWYWIVAAVVAAVIVVVIIVFVILNKKSDKAFDINTGEYIDKKKV